MNIHSHHSSIILVNTLILIVSLLLPHVSIGKTLYVIDQLRVTLRSGQGKEFQVLKTLTSGSKLELLELSDDGYAFVRTGSGIEGWVSARFLSDQLINRDKLILVEKNIGRMEEENKKLKDSLTAIKNKKELLQKKLTQLTEDMNDTQQELSHIENIAKQPIKISEENAKLVDRFATTENEIKILRQENRLLKDRSDKDWFITGAGVLLTGILMGILILKIGRRQNASWSLFRTFF